MIPIAVLVALVAALVPTPFLVDAQAQAIIAGTVRSKAGKPLPGLVLLEKGEIHNNVWDRGTLVNAQGTFRIEVASAGPYGLHVYSSGYIYAPQAVKVETGKTLGLQIVLVPEPTRANTPAIRKVGFFPWEARQGKVTFVKADVVDPNQDLGPQVLALTPRRAAPMPWSRPARCVTSRPTSPTASTSWRWTRRPRRRSAHGTGTWSWPTTSAIRRTS